MSGGVDIERDRGLAPGFAARMVLGWASWVNTGWLHDWVGVFGGVESPDAVDRLKTMCSFRQPCCYDTAGKLVELTLHKEEEAGRSPASACRRPWKQSCRNKEHEPR